LKAIESRPAPAAVASADSQFRRRWLLAGLGLPLLAATVATALIARPATDTNPPALDLSALAATTAAPVTAAPTADDPDSVEVTVQRNDTLDRIFRSVGLDMSTLAELRSRPEVRKALDVLRPGDIILSIARSEDGYAVNYIENPLETEMVGRHARIESSLFEAGQKAGISAETILTLANQMFGWDIDFALDIREGDEFSVLYEQRFQDGHYVSDGKVLAAEFVNQGRTHRAVWFESHDGQVKGYFTPEGKGMRKAFLRAPLDFTRISSPFNSRRLHPILGIVRAHKGTDYAAPVGTRIWAAGDGRVVFAGRKGGYGNVVIIDHGKGVRTVYGHISRFGKGIRPGRRVSQGEVIAYVGMTGLATGPHLHYEYLVNGTQRNPARLEMPRTEIPSQYLAEFRNEASASLAKLDLTNGSASTTQVASR